jgi:hypothetical protein
VHLVDLVPPPLPIPSVLFFSGLALWVVFSVLVRRSLGLQGYDPLKLAGLSWDVRSQVRYSISNRRLSDDPSVRALAIEWSKYEVRKRSHYGEPERAWRFVLMRTSGILADETSQIAATPYFVDHAVVTGNAWSTKCSVAKERMSL